MNEHTTLQSGNPAGTNPPQAGLMPMLSVFLLLLAFFIMLVSMVEFDERRTQAALQSLNATFNAHSFETSDRRLGAEEASAGVANQIAVEFGTVLKTLLRDGSYSISNEDAIAYVEIENSELFAEDLTPAPRLKRVAQGFADIVKAAPRRFRYEVQVLQPLGEAGATRRAGILARAFEEADIASRRLMTGLVSIERGKTRIEVYTITPGQDADIGRWQSRTPAR